MSQEEQNQGTSSENFASLQEKIIHELSKHLLDGQALICPDTYGQSKEPADIAWITGRCAILMYMTESVGSFEKKKRHNLRQLRRWLKAWKSGQQLIGKSGEIHHRIKYDDVDHIVGLSIIDGGEVWCQDHSDEIRSSKDEKLSVCATITGRILRELVLNGCGPRDLISYLRHLQDSFPNSISEESFSRFIKSNILSTSFMFRDRFSGMWNSSSDLNRYWREAVGIMRSLKPHIRDNGIALPCDLTANDIIWLGVAEASLITQIAQPGEFGPVRLGAVRTSGNYTLKCIVFAHMGVAAQHAKSLVPDQPGLIWLSSLDFGHDAPHRMLIPYPRTGPSNLEIDLGTMRKSALLRSL